jgi:GDP-D-mannose dehydratase
MKNGNKRCAVITGVSGQDAYYLTLKLIEQGVRVVGTTSNTKTNLPFVDYSIFDSVSIIEWDLLDQKRFAEILEE